MQPDVPPGRLQARLLYHNSPLSPARQVAYRLHNANRHSNFLQLEEPECLLYLGLFYQG
jgi:hypothetical protein